MAGDSGPQQPDEKTFLGFPMRPEGDGETVKCGRHHWYELAGELHGTFADIDRAIAGVQWSGDARKAFDAAWSRFSGHGTEAGQHAHEMGDHLHTLGNQIEDAQHEWDIAMAAMVASTLHRPHRRCGRPLGDGVGDPKVTKLRPMPIAWSAVRSRCRWWSHPRAQP
jgi:uncharacterized protein YukE